MGKVGARSVAAAALGCRQLPLGVAAERPGSLAPTDSWLFRSTDCQRLLSVPASERRSLALAFSQGQGQSPLRRTAPDTINLSQLAPRHLQACFDRLHQVAGDDDGYEVTLISLTGLHTPHWLPHVRCVGWVSEAALLAVLVLLGPERPLHQCIWPCLRPDDLASLLVLDLVPACQAPQVLPHLVPLLAQLTGLELSVLARRRALQGMVRLLRAYFEPALGLDRATRAQLRGGWRADLAADGGAAAAVCGALAGVHYAAAYGVAHVLCIDDTLVRLHAAGELLRGCMQAPTPPLWAWAQGLAAGEAAMAAVLRVPEYVRVEVDAPLRCLRQAVAARIPPTLPSNAAFLDWFDAACA